MPEWIAQNIGTALTAGASIVVAIIGAIGIWWRANHTPKQPIPIQDVWTENRLLRADLAGTEKERNEYRDLYEASMDAFRALWAYTHRLIAAWGARPDMPVMSPWERRKVSAVVPDTDTPPQGTTTPN